MGACPSSATRELPLGFKASNRIHKTTSTEEDDAVQNAFRAAPRRDSVGVA